MSRKALRMRFGWYLGWVFGIGFITLPILALVYAIMGIDIRLWYWVVTGLLLVTLLPLGYLIIKYTIEEYKTTTDI